jgi:hypothetical protein
MRENKINKMISLPALPFGQYSLSLVYEKVYNSAGISFASAIFLRAYFDFEDMAAAT